MNELIPDKKAYQVNKRRMAWSALLMMAAVTVATIVAPSRMAEADSVLMGSIHRLKRPRRGLFWLLRNGREERSGDEVT